ncbi:hypothetical protein ACJRO7_026960 [Eucalyptus globulus]|uniref:Uncharacterized protein n=1 Tax=Eucalyptus globulus TaxID=34317 RepID=A0ABD3JVS3_EUCGL
MGNVTANHAKVLRQPQADPTMPKGNESRDRSNVVGKAIGAKSSYIVCEECAEERERGEGPSAFHCCPCDPVVVGFRDKAGPISRPSGSHLGLSDQVMVESRSEVGSIFHQIILHCTLILFRQ